MKVKVRATVTYEWEEDSANWDDGSTGVPIENEADLLATMQAYADDDPSYILDCEPADIGQIEIVK